MAETKTLNIKVDELSKYGFKANGEYVNYSKQFPEGQKVGVVPGATLEAEVYIADSGKKYLNKVLGVGAAPKEVSTPVSDVVDTERARKFTPKYKAKTDTSMTKDDWAAKDRSQMIGGLSHDAAQLVHAAYVTGASLSDIMRDYKTALEQLIQLRTEVK